MSEEVDPQAQVAIGRCDSGKVVIRVQGGDGKAILYGCDSDGARLVAEALLDVAKETP